MRPLRGDYMYFDQFKRIIFIPGVDLLALLSIVALVIQGISFLWEDVLFFNYVNNATNARALYYYYGYVPVFPEVATYLLKPLPFVVQALLYRAVPCLIILLFYREIKLFFHLYCNDTEAGVLGLAVIFFMRFVEPNSVGLLWYAHWPALFVAFIHVIRKQIDRTSYSVVGVSGLLLAVLSNPLAVLLVPVLLSDLNLNKKSIQRHDVAN